VTRVQRSTRHIIGHLFIYEFQERVFPGNQLCWYWQPNYNQIAYYIKHKNITIIIGSDRRSEPNNFRPPYDQIADVNLTFTPCLYHHVLFQATAYSANISNNYCIWIPMTGWHIIGVVLRLYTSIFPQSQFFCILAVGSGQWLLYRLGSGLRLVLVLGFCALNLINS